MQTLCSTEHRTCSVVLQRFYIAMFLDCGLKIHGTHPAVLSLASSHSKYILLKERIVIMGPKLCALIYEMLPNENQK
jgi:hypothetical protein